MNVALREIPTSRIVPDSDVQFAWSYNPAWEKRFGSYDAAKAGVIDVVPFDATIDRRAYIDELVATYGDVYANTPLTGDLFAAFVGRHRNIAARRSGERTMRADVHRGLTVSEKHLIKLAKDRNRRSVRKVEIFYNEVGAGEPTATAVLAAATAHGWKIGRLRGGSQPYDTIEAVTELYPIQRDGLLSEFFELNECFKGLARANSAYWIHGIGFAVRDGWPTRLTPEGRERLRMADVHRITHNSIAASDARWPVRGAAPGISETLRKLAKVRPS